MRFVFAIVSFAVAALLIAVGVAQRTVFAGPDSVAATAEVRTEAPLLVIDGETLNTFPGRQTLRVEGEGAVFAAYGRTSDVQAWVGDASYNTVSYDAEQQTFVTEHHAGSEEVVPDPHGSDLWYSEYRQEGALSFGVSVPRDISVVIASDGTAAAPSAVSVVWPVTSTKPWSGPLIIAGAVMLLVGLLLLFWAIVHLRRSRGPRRRQPVEPETSRQRRLPRLRPRADAGVPPLESRGRARSRTIAVAGLTIGALALSGCSAADWPEFITGNHPITASSVEDETDATATEGADEPEVAVTERQAERILSDIGRVVSQADAELNADLAATRLSGPALALRQANYAARATDSAIAPLVPAITPDPVRLLLPQQTQAGVWPRTVLAVTQPAEPADEPAPGAEPDVEAPAEPDAAASTAGSVALVLVQPDARSPYRVEYAMTITRSIPEVAPPTIGAARLSADTKLLAIAPSEIGELYGDVLLNGDASERIAEVDTTDDPLLAAFGATAKAERAARLAEDNAASTYTEEAGSGPLITLATNDLGGLVILDRTETETVKPSAAGSALNSAGAIKALSGREQSTKGFIATYGMQLLFYVPPPGKDGGKQIVLLGYSQGLIAASEVN